jgi:hypothetical protein
MKNHVALVNKFGDNRQVVNRVNRVMKTRVALEMLDILDATCREVINHKHFVAALKISIGKVRPDKTRPTCNQNSQTFLRSL